MSGQTFKDVCEAGVRRSGSSGRGRRRRLRGRDALIILLRSRLRGTCTTSTETAGLPEKALAAALGCGIPRRWRNCKPANGAVSGLGRRDRCVAVAKRVGVQREKPTVRDMTDEVAGAARENQKSPLTNVNFLKGSIESIPLPDHSVTCHFECVSSFRRQGPRVSRGLSAC